MDPLAWIDFYSGVWLFGGTVACTLALTAFDLRRMAQTAMAISLPMGVLGTLVGFVMMLQAMDDPSTIGPAVSVALLTTLYGSVIYLFLYALVGARSAATTDAPVAGIQGSKRRASPVPAEKAEARDPVIVIIRVVIAVLLFAGTFVGAVLIGGASVLSFLDGMTLLWVLPLTLVLTACEGRGDLDRWIPAFGRHSMLVGCLGTLPAAIALLQTLDDPASIGPALAMMLLSLFYGGIFYLVAVFLQAALGRKPFSFVHKASLGYAALMLFPLVVAKILFPPM